jgi:hypothetical protein
MADNYGHPHNPEKIGSADLTFDAEMEVSVLQTHLRACGTLSGN